MRWAVVVPVKAAALGKSRLVRPVGELEVAADGDEADRAALVRAMAVDTIVAAATTPRVAAVLVVTPDASVAAELDGLDLPVPVTVVPEPLHDGGPGTGAGPEPRLDAAVAAGVAAARGSDVLAPPAEAVAVLLGDLPGLRPADLEDALALAAGHGRALVPDAAGTGTTLLTAWSTEPDVPLPTRFGRGSAQAHAALGYVVMDDVPITSSLRHDVDVHADLVLAERDGLGPRTREVLARLER
ncbi:2-phospho-L-lactate guanylyltransferase [Cellulomonas marina]|nr:2-phospho-L-lactate guanylyltransferase [Cellulomonas marina]